MMLAPAIFALVLAITVPYPFGSKATQTDFNKFGALASWYTWPLHGALVLTDNLVPMEVGLGPCFCRAL